MCYVVSSSFISRLAETALSGAMAQEITISINQVLGSILSIGKKEKKVDPKI